MLPDGLRLVGVFLVALVLGTGAPAHAEKKLARAARVDPIADFEVRPAVGYERGRARRIKVVQIGWAEVELSTARAFLRMAAAAQKDGVELWIKSGFRSHEHQVWFYEAYRSGYGNPAARPGYSNHQSGRALDLDILGEGTYAWLEKHAKKYGFARTVRGEPWHWELVKKARRKRSR